MTQNNLLPDDRADAEHAEAIQKIIAIVSGWQVADGRASELLAYARDVEAFYDEKAAYKPQERPAPVSRVVKITRVTRPPMVVFDEGGLMTLFENGIAEIEAGYTAAVKVALRAFRDAGDDPAEWVQKALALQRALLNERAIQGDEHDDT